jgi:hypothetical protein
MALKFCTLADARLAFGNQQDGYTGDDALITQQIETATALIQEYTRREWTQAVRTQYFSGADVDAAINRGRGYVKFSLREKNPLLDPYPTVRYSPSGKFGNATDLTREAYSVDQRLSQIIIYPTVFSSTGRSIQIIATTGFPLSDVVGEEDVVLVPQNLRAACAKHAAFSAAQILNQTSGNAATVSQSAGSTFRMSRSGLVMEAFALVKSEVRTFVGSDG